jgi:hypothetical protein
MAPPKRKGGGRVTPKGTRPGSLPTAAAAPGSSGAGGEGTVRRAAEASSRYTPPIPKELRESPKWVPILMFSLLILGALVIFFNYLGVPFDTNNWYLILGLVLILGGIVTATQYR